MFVTCNNNTSLLMPVYLRNVVMKLQTFWLLPLIFPLVQVKVLVIGRMSQLPLLWKRVISTICQLYFWLEISLILQDERCWISTCPVSISTLDYERTSWFVKPWLLYSKLFQKNNNLYSSKTITCMYILSIKIHNDYYILH